MKRDFISLSCIFCLHKNRGSVGNFYTYLNAGKDAAKHLQYEGQLLPTYYPYLACLHSNLALYHADDAEILLKLTHVLPGSP